MGAERPNRWVGAVLVGLALGLALIGATWVALRGWPSSTDPLAPLKQGVAHGLDRGQNALWMRRFWIHGGAPRDVERLTGELGALGVTRIYPFLGPMDPDGWPGWRDEGAIARYRPQTAAEFLGAMRVSAPHVQVLPWTGGNLDQDVHLLDGAQRSAFADHARRLVELGASGVHLNVEPMPSGQPGYLALLRAVDASIGEATLSVAAYPPASTLHPFPSVHWTAPFTREVCAVADELAVMAYDTSLDDPAAFEGLVARWTTELRLLPTRAEGGCDLLIGVPAYEDDEPWHRPDAETIESGLRGVIRGSRGPGRPVDGVAVYASWTTDPAEWRAYEELWRERPASDAIVTDR